MKPLTAGLGPGQRYERPKTKTVKPLILRVADALRKGSVTRGLLAEMQADAAGELAATPVQMLAALAEWCQRDIADREALEAVLARQIERRAS